MDLDKLALLDVGKLSLLAKIVEADKEVRVAEADKEVRVAEANKEREVRVAEELTKRAEIELKLKAEGDAGNYTNL